ncbi:MAG: hypothetical protein HC910_22685 [Spirulinaceae cyanobacterium SM2_1_0]|nr:hypothetical protein [Spirulinaceae cyanobacterium SM2_1_0]
MPETLSAMVWYVAIALKDVSVPEMSLACLCSPVVPVGLAGENFTRE